MVAPVTRTRDGMVVRQRRAALPTASRMAACLLLVVTGCTQDEAALPPGTQRARPGGPYELLLATEPTEPTAGTQTQLVFTLTRAPDARPVGDLQRAHERLMHNFIVAHDFSSFAHVHHEDHAPVSAADRASGTLRVPYRFPAAGRYRVVSEFAHRDRAWLKHADVEVLPGSDTRAAAPADDGYSATLVTSPAQPVAGFETALALDIYRDGTPVEDLELYLGSELHGAVWREDLRYFGHLHSYTPRVAAIMQAAHERGGDPLERGARIAEMMVRLMCLEAEQSFTGPRIPLRYVFPAPGRYRLFLQVAPGGRPRVFRFDTEVVAARDGVDTTIDEALVRPVTTGS